MTSYNLEVAHPVSGKREHVASSRPVLSAAPRPELMETLRAGEIALHRAFARSGGTPRTVAPRGRPLTRAGEPADELYRVCIGWLCRTRQLEDGRRQILEVYLPGDTVGADALLWSSYHDSVEPLTRVIVSTLSVFEAREIMARHPAAALWLMLHVADEGRRIGSLATSLGRVNAETRLCWFLLRLAGRLRRLDLVRGQRFRLPMTQQDLGDHLGLTPVHVNRVLARLRAVGAVSVDRQTVTIRDVTQLNRLAAPMLANDHAAAQDAIDGRLDGAGCGLVRRPP